MRLEARGRNNAVTDTKSDIPSVVERTRPLKADAPIVGAHFFANTAVLVLGDEALLLVPRQGEARRLAVHGGAILSSSADAERIITGGDDGKVIASGPDGTSTTIATDAKRRWIDHVAAGPGGAVGWSAGKQAFVRTAKKGSGGEERMLELPSTAGGLAFAPKGLRLAIARYNGLSLWFPNAQSEPEKLEWKGSHLGVTWSPDGKFAVTSMQEPVLHGWRVADGKDMRMSGYGARVRSLDWSAGGKWLATSGSSQLILWPFQGKDGPMGKQPRILAPAEAQADVVACHPRQEVVAVGYADGLVLLVRIDDGAEVLAHKGGGAPITALAWSAAGGLLAFGTEDGEAGVIDLG
jgi:WD40 repeat protein